MFWARDKKRYHGDISFLYPPVINLIKAQVYDIVGYHMSGEVISVLSLEDIATRLLLRYCHESDTADITDPIIQSRDNLFLHSCAFIRLQIGK